MVIGQRNNRGGVTGNKHSGCDSIIMIMDGERYFYHIFYKCNRNEGRERLYNTFLQGKFVRVFRSSKKSSAWDPVPIMVIKKKKGFQYRKGHNICMMDSI